MTTLALLWYACGWAGLGFWAIDFEIIRVRNLLLCMVFGPLLILSLAVYAMVKFCGLVLWQAKE